MKINNNHTLTSLNYMCSLNRFKREPREMLFRIIILVNGKRILNVTEQMCSEYKNSYICKTNNIFHAFFSNLLIFGTRYSNLNF